MYSLPASCKYWPGGAGAAVENQCLTPSHWQLSHMPKRYHAPAGTVLYCIVLYVY